MGREITDNMLAAFMEGSATPQEVSEILRAAQNDAELRDVLRVVMEVDLGSMHASSDAPEFHAYAADSGGSNICAILCEQRVLERFGVGRSVEQLQAVATERGWLTGSGVEMHNIGNLLEMEGLQVSRTFHNDASTLSAALVAGAAIVVVDSNELKSSGPELAQEYLDDMLYGYEPNHAVVVEAVSEGSVTYYDPAYAEGCRRRVATMDEFLNAWNDSGEYMVEINCQSFPADAGGGRGCAREPAHPARRR